MAATPRPDTDLLEAEMTVRTIGVLLVAMLLGACNAATGPEVTRLAHVDAVSNGGRTGVAVTSSAGPALSLASAERSRRGMPGLAGHGRLMRAAQDQAAFMARNGVMTHSGEGGTRMADRIKRTGYTACFAAENVAFGQRSGQEVMTAWMNSPGHRRNILDGRARDAAVASATDGAGQVYWAMLLATPC